MESHSCLTIHIVKNLRTLIPASVNSICYSFFVSCNKSQLYMRDCLISEIQKSKSYQPKSLVVSTKNLRYLLC